MANTKTKEATMSLESVSFEDGSTIPKQFTCDGKEMSPSFTFSGIPKKTKSLAFIMEDPDASAGPFTHWLLYNLPPDTDHFEEEMPNTTPMIGLAGENDGGTIGYIGPCPPSGAHRYIFTLYALDKMLDLPAGASKAEVMSAMKGHIIEQAQMTGKYRR